MIERKTGSTIDAIAEQLRTGDRHLRREGSELRMNGKRPGSGRSRHRGVKDPTGAGDAYRSGLIKGLLLGQDLEVVGRIAGLTATYAVEHVGTQEHQLHAG